MDYKAKQAAEAAGVAALVACNPHLIPAGSCKGGSLIAAAKNMRIELALAFPGVKFGIKSRRFSMGDAIDVSWVDGPTTSQVDEIIDRYSAGSFNGMEDIYEYRGDRCWTEAFGDAKYLHSKRYMSDAAIERAMRLVCSRYGLPPGAYAVQQYRKGELWSVRSVLGVPLPDTLQDLISYAAYRQCYALTKPYVRSLVEEV